MKTRFLFSLDELDLISILQNEERNWDYDETSLSIFKKTISRVKYRILDYETEQECIRLAALGDKKAQENLILSHLRFVVHVAKKYQNHGVLLNDLISEGIIGLMTAATKVQDRGFRFKSYAVYCIRSAIKNAISNYGSTVRYPSNIIQQNFTISNFVLQYYQKNGYEPDTDEILNALDLSEKIIDQCDNVIEETISIDSLIDNYKDISYVDDFINYHTNYPEIDTSASWILSHHSDWYEIDEDLHKALHRYLRHVTDRGRDILKMYYGFGCREHSLEEIAEKFDLTRERVRQIREQSVRKLRGRKNSFLRQYLNYENVSITMIKYNPLDSFLREENIQEEDLT